MRILFSSKSVIRRRSAEGMLSCNGSVPNSYFLGSPFILDARAGYLLEMCWFRTKAFECACSEWCEWLNTSNNPQPPIRRKQSKLSTITDYNNLLKLKRSGHTSSKMHQGELLSTTHHTAESKSKSQRLWMRTKPIIQEGASHLTSSLSAALWPLGPRQ